MNQAQPKYVVRLPDLQFREQLAQAAKKNGRSVNAEIVARLASREATRRDQIADRVLAALCANPSIFQANDQSGWDLVNCTEEQLCAMSYRLADAQMKTAKP